MTHEDDNEPEPPAVVAAITEAQEMVKKLCTVLGLAGYDAVVLSISRVIEIAPGDFRAPGATATVIDKPRVGPLTRQLADVLRKQADMLDKYAGDEEIASGYIHDRTDYASGMAEWPK